MLTIEQHLGSLKNKRITIIGDIRHSRVARSNLWGLTTMGAQVTLCAPSTLTPRNREFFNGVHFEQDVRKAVHEADAVIALRLQKERMDDSLLPSMREYRNFFGITREVLEQASPSALIMHPGPINRGVELDSEMADSDQSVILEQVTNGVAVRMAVLFLLSGGRASE
jgi:aspartate carbamoyltransferase catalytic subunit